MPNIDIINTKDKGFVLIGNKIFKEQGAPLSSGLLNRKTK